MNLGLEGKVALVAASSRGLGRAVAEELAREGASLVLCARGEGALSEACDQIAKTAGAGVLGVAADVSVPEDAARVVREGVEKFGRVDILVTNPGGPPAGRFETLSREDWERATRLTLTSAIELTRAALPGMKERRWGRVLNITSIAVKQPVENLMLSNSMRAAVTGWARTLANEVAPFGITVNNLMPGFTRTERMEELARATAKREGIAEAEAIARWEREIPMGRLAEAREFAALAAFLASERAGYITAASIPVDGGWIRALL